MARSRDISKVLSSNTTLSNSYLTLASASTTYAPVASGGLVQIVPTSIASTGGSSSVSSNGVVTFTGTSIISLNGCFNSSYQNYRVIINFTPTTTGTLGLRFRANGSDNTVSNAYYFAGAYIYQQGSVTANSSNPASIGRVARYDGGTGFTAFDVMDPSTSGAATSTAGFSTGGGADWESLFNYFADGTYVFDGFSLIPSAGTITGKIRVYGYKN